MTYILVSHDLAVVAYLCQSLAVMQRGEIVEQLSVAQLVAGEATHPYTRGLIQWSGNA